MKLKQLYLYGTLALATLCTSCEDFLDREPISSVTPDEYYQSEEQIQAAVNKLYEILPGHTGSYGVFGEDGDTDNQVYVTPGNQFTPDLWKTSMTGGSWDWTNVRNINYTLDMVLTNLEKGIVTGNETRINHYIGELYFLRAFTYFNLLRALGDLPIVTEPLPVDEGALVEACQKAVAHCEAKNYPIEKLAIQYSVSNPRIATTLFSSANPDNVLKNIQYTEEPIDWELVKEVQDIIGDQKRVGWANS